MKNKSHKCLLHSAFTLLELVFVIVVMGIIAAVMIPRTGSNNLYQAATQVSSHIKYTQHLAMLDDKYGTTKWFNKRWRVMFSNSADTNFQWCYTIFDDREGGATGNAGSAEVALNPMDTSKRLSGGATGSGSIRVGDSDVTKKMNLGSEYGIQDIDFSANCRTGTSSSTIAFDHMGRPLRGALKNYISAYDSSIATNIVISGQCIIDLCKVNPCPAGNSNDKISIAIEPETGYVHILDN